MADHPSSSEFPPLGSSSGGVAQVLPRNWNQVFAPDASAPKAFHFTHHPSKLQIIPFSGDKLSKGGEDWKLCLIGYSIGRRPFYEALLGAIKKTWSLKGSLQLLSLNEGFFLLRFSCQEDLDMAWSHGVWFLLGKRFVLQKWHSKFKPVKEEFSSVPIWVKIHDLPLACWNSEGISRIASKIGIPVAADKLTEQKTRLTFARVCVLVDNLATYPEEIHVSLDGDVVTLKVQYEWRPNPCEHCKSLMHVSYICSTKLKIPSEAQDGVNTGGRGRSYSRKPHHKHSSSNLNHSRPPSTKTQSEPQNININAPSTSQPSVPINVIGQALHFQPHSPTSLNIPPPYAAGVIPVTKLPLSADAVVSGIPNLNSPHETISSSSTSKNIPTSKDIISPNKFEILNSEEELSSHQDEILDDKIGSKDCGHAKIVDKGKQTQASVASKKPARVKQSKNPQALSHS
ncbi:hypothetical protein MA16_Dca001658 [Dendrobium catenatum]|uniref:DUF4283 domain-containing protein n=1 Tax=Dendrobium catenatum TaxID=906689 RepID=A0A2I0WN04_9ASPA|nr:hypothetical protein MA16_Dca001658 [Dendrobium catenatum]